VSAAGQASSVIPSKLYALDAKLSLKVDASKADVERAMKGQILAQAELIGRYGR
jgi:phosphatidylethanolamine-binding protein (PEBP) family uncharacterized protein